MSEDPTAASLARGRALIVDDEPAVRRHLRNTLSSNGYRTVEAGTGAEALKAAGDHRFDVIFLDPELPDRDGVSITRALREWCSTPIIILSVRHEESFKVAALDAGADDYMTKPFGVEELMARVRALSRRCEPQAEEPVIVSGSLTIDRASRRVFCSGQVVALTPTEYDILRALARRGGKVVTHTQLISEVWGHLRQDLHTLRVNVSNLRRKIELDSARPRLVITEPAIGYRFELI